MLIIHNSLKAREDGDGEVQDLEGMVRVGVEFREIRNWDSNFDNLKDGCGAVSHEVMYLMIYLDAHRRSLNIGLPEKVKQVVRWTIYSLNRLSDRFEITLGVKEFQSR